MLDTETLSRCVFLKDHVNRASGTIGWRAFLEKRPELSVLRIDGLTGEQIWAYADEWIAKPNNREILARGDFPVSALPKLSLPLRAIPAPPPDRHANLVDWPEQLEAKKNVAQELRKAATAVIR